MKRLTLLTVLLVVLGLASGFALEVKPAFTLSGSATVSWGVDLDTGYTGFYNTADGDFVVTLVAADSSDTHKGEGAWYGEITLSNLELYWTDGVQTGAGADYAAKIVGLGGNLAIGVYAAPDLATDSVAALEADSDLADTVVDDESAADVGNDYGTYGTYISYQIMKELMLGFEVVSDLDWGTNTAGNAAQAYAFALDFTATFAPLTVTGGVNYGVNYAANPFGFTVKVAADTDMVDPYVAFDAAIDGGFAWEVGAGAVVTVVKDTTFALDVVYGDPQFDNLDLKAVFTEPAAAGLVDGLDFTLTAWVLDILGTAGLEFEIIADGGYKMGDLYPNFTVTYGDANDAAAFLEVDLGVDWTAIPLTTLGLYWHSGDLFTPTYGYIEAFAKVTY